MWLVGVVVRRYIGFLILLIPIYSSCICSFLQQHPYFLFIFCNVISFLFYNNYIVKFGPLNRPGAHFACNNYLLPTATSACEQLRTIYGSVKFD